MDPEPWTRLRLIGSTALMLGTDLTRCTKESNVLEVVDLVLVIFTFFGRLRSQRSLLEDSLSLLFILNWNLISAALTGFLGGTQTRVEAGHAGLFPA